MRFLKIQKVKMKVSEVIFRVLLTKLTALLADLDPTVSDAGTKTLERKQRHADGTPETIILNKVPIIPYIKDEKRPVVR